MPVSLQNWNYKYHLRMFFRTLGTADEKGAAQRRLRIRSGRLQCLYGSHFFPGLPLNNTNILIK